MISDSDISDGIYSSVEESMNFHAYGTRRNSDMVTEVPERLVDNKGFTGHEHIEESGLIHMNGRVYDPQIGRFLSADPFVQAPESSQSFNRYSYVMNNPLSLVDPSGYVFEELLDGDLSGAWVDAQLEFDFARNSINQHIAFETANFKQETAHIDWEMAGESTVNMLGSTAGVIAGAAAIVIPDPAGNVPSSAAGAFLIGVNSTDFALNFDNFLTAFSRDSLASKTYLPDDYESLVSGWGSKRLGLNEQSSQYFELGMKFTRLALDFKVIRKLDNFVITEPYKHKNFGKSGSLTQDILLEDKYVSPFLQKAAIGSAAIDTWNLYSDNVFPVLEK